MKSRVVLLFAAVALTPLILFGQAPPCTDVAGTYTTEGATTGTEGNWTLTSVSGTTASAVIFTPSQPIPFADLQQLSATFNVTAGGVGTGTPRFSVQIDTNGDSVGDGWMFIQLGDSPDFTGDNTEVNAYSGDNMIGNNDPARYDTSQFGGTTADTYSGALALLGDDDVLAVMFVTDEGGTRTLTLNSIDLCALTPDLSVTKTQTGGEAVIGGTLTYQIVVTNVGTGDTSGTVTVTDTADGLVIESMFGTGWSCDTPTATCTRSDVLAPGASYDPITVEARVMTSGTVTNTATVEGGGDSTAANNVSSVDAAALAAPADVPMLDPRALVALLAVLAVIGARRLLS